MNPQPFTWPNRRTATAPSFSRATVTSHASGKHLAPQSARNLHPLPCWLDRLSGSLEHFPTGSGLPSTTNSQAGGPAPLSSLVRALRTRANEVFCARRLTVASEGNRPGLRRVIDQ